MWASFARCPGPSESSRLAEGRALWRGARASVRASQGEGVTRFEVLPSQSTIVIAARSSVGAINWQVAGPVGHVDCVVADGAVDLSVPPTGLIEVRMDQFRSGNAVYDAELLERVDARRFPVATVELESVRTTASEARLEAGGTVTLHGVTRPVDGSVVVEFTADGHLRLTGEKVIDIRDFDIPVPVILMLRIYPSVRAHLFLELRPA